MWQLMLLCKRQMNFLFKRVEERRGGGTEGEGKEDNGRRRGEGEEDEK
jgi:hypothetical protein